MDEETKEAEVDGTEEVGSFLRKEEVGSFLRKEEVCE